MSIVTIDEQTAVVSSKSSINNLVHQGKHPQWTMTKCYLIMSASSIDTIQVLHVDDEPGFLEMSAEFIEQEEEPMQVETSESPIDAFDRITENTPHCVVSDYDMPRQNGLEFLEAVRNEHPKLPFILFTGRGSEEVASEAISKGVTDYLNKGSGTSQYQILCNRIKNAVKERQTQRNKTTIEQRLATITDHCDDFLWMVNSDWSEVLFINSAYEDLWGRSTNELYEDPKLLIEGVHPNDRDDVRKAMQRLETGEPVNIEFRVNGKKEFGVWVWVKGRPVLDDSGDVSKIVGSAQDITERKAREQQLRRRNEQLNEFTSIVSHDLRNPLSVARGRLELARSEAESEHLDDADQALIRMKTLIDDVLELARTGAESTDTAPVLISDII